MKKRKFQSGGLTQADRDAGLTEADIALGLRAGRQSSITDAERESAIARANRLSAPSIVDQYRDFDKNPAAQAMPVDMSERRTPRAAPRPAPRPAARPRAEAAPLAREPMTNEIPSGYQPAEPRRAPPSRGSYDRPGPVGDLMEIIRGRMNRPSPYRRGTRTEADEIIGAKRGGSVNKMAKKKSTSSASRRADGIATKGKTKGRMV
jgi:hypothetical protein